MEGGDCVPACPPANRLCGSWRIAGQWAAWTCTCAADAGRARAGSRREGVPRTAGDLLCAYQPQRGRESRAVSSESHSGLICELRRRRCRSLAGGAR